MKRERAILLRWYRKHRRDLPWRRVSDPYAIWISESMLQQTRVETVIPYYERFLSAFPDVHALADADTDEVLELWSGLGYYRRARNLQNAAKKIVTQFGGKLPDRAETLRELPGVGPYTAGAIASIAFDRPEPLVDGNVARVLARYLGIRAEIASRAATKKLWEVAGSLVQGEAPGDLNQALMEFGSLVCTPRAPQCPTCPLKNNCVARQSGTPEAFPVKAKRAATPRLHAAAVLLERGGKYLLVRRKSEGLLGGLWELPGGELTPRTALGLHATQVALRERIATSLGLELDALRKLDTVEHLFSHRHLVLQIFRGEIASGKIRRDGYVAHRWATRRELDALAQSSLMRKVLQRCKLLTEDANARKR